MIVTLIGQDGKLDSSLGGVTKLPTLPARDYVLPEGVRIRIEEYFPHNDQVLTVAFEVRNSTDSSKYGQLEGSATLINGAKSNGTLGNLCLDIIANNMDAAYELLAMAHEKVGLVPKSATGEAFEPKKIYGELLQLIQNQLETPWLEGVGETTGHAILRQRSVTLQSVIELLETRLFTEQSAGQGQMTPEGLERFLTQDLSVVDLLDDRAKLALRLSGVNDIGDLHGLSEARFRQILTRDDIVAGKGWIDNQLKNVKDFFSDYPSVDPWPCEGEGSPGDCGCDDGLFGMMDEGFPTWHGDPIPSLDPIGVEAQEIEVTLPGDATRGRPVAEDGSTGQDRTINPSPLKFDGDGSAL